ncbi:MAG: pyrroline-5-carboxylate reductase [Betaproteobacteria bacterium]
MRILFLGGGNMATALIGGLLQRGVEPGAIRVIDVSESAREALQRQFGVSAASALEGEILEDIVLLAVKPQQVRDVAKGVRAHLRGQLVISIAAGVRTTDLARWLGGHERIVRAMPNTPALIRSGICGLFAPAAVIQADRDRAQSLLDAVGGVVWVNREQDIDAVTAVSGSGPAYVYYFIEALEQAGVELGLTATQAHELAVHTFVGAARLAAASPDPAQVLRARVTSKAGTTEAALKVMDAHAVKSKIVEAVQAAARRSRELGDDFGKD